MGKRGITRTPSLKISPMKTRSSGKSKEDKKTQPKIKDAWKGTTARVQRGRGQSSSKTSRNNKKDSKVINVDTSEDVTCSPSFTNTEVTTTSRIIPSISRDEADTLLKAFDIDYNYGQCAGISRMQRYERAIRYNMTPSPDPLILQVLKEYADDEYLQRSRWDTHPLLGEFAPTKSAYMGRKKMN